MKFIYLSLLLVLFTVAGSVQHNRWLGSIPGSPYFSTNILVEELTNNVTFVISNGSPIIIKQ